MVYDISYNPDNENWLGQSWAEKVKQNEGQIRLPSPDEINEGLKMEE